MTRIVILHYQPIEYYPPVMNILNNLSYFNVEIIVLTSSNDKGLAQFTHDGINIKRIDPPFSKFKFFKSIRHLYYSIFAVFVLILKRPSKILYYETFSVLPAYVYKVLWQGTEIYNHCHEYYSNEWYRKSGFIMRFLHNIEKKSFFEKCKIISHTNSDRIKLIEIKQ